MQGAGGSVVIRGVGAYVPERVLTNDELEKIVDTSDEWIRSRTGIRERRLAGEAELTSDMALAASRRAIERAGVELSAIDAVIVATVTPDMPFPSTASLLQARLGLRNVPAFDMQAACTGFLYAMEVARGLVASGMARNVLVAGAEKVSCILDWTDRNTCVLFGDGAGATIIGRSDRPNIGIRHTILRSDGSLQNILKVPGGGSLCPASAQSLADGKHFIQMSGREVFRHAVRNMGDAARDVLAEAEVDPGSLRYVVSHQANMRIIEALAHRLGIGIERFPVNLDRYGNTSAASIPLVLDELVSENRVSPGDELLLVSFGAGLTWGASLIQWT